MFIHKQQQDNKFLAFKFMEDHRVTHVLQVCLFGWKPLTEPMLTDCQLEL